jgi:hypothetical protein
LLNFDEHQVFNNNEGGNLVGLFVQAYSKKERVLYEERIKHLEKEVEFLRNLLNKKSYTETK